MPRLHLLALLALVAGCGGAAPSAPAPSPLERADALWEAPATRDAAAERYQSLYPGLPPAAQRRVLARLVPYLVLAGRPAEARAWVRTGLAAGHRVPYTGAAGQLALPLEEAHDRAERQERARRETERQQQEVEAAAQAAAERARQEKVRRRQREAADVAAAQSRLERERAGAAAAKRAEEELDSGGLVLLRKTVRGETDRFATRITGTVENRTGRALDYAEIRFAVYDADGGQVGTALANISSLEKGGRWSFRAVSLRPGATYKLLGLSGH